MVRPKLPKFKDSTCYKEWKETIIIWNEVTDEPENKRAGLIILSIENSKAKRELLRRKNDIATLSDLVRVLDELFRHEIDPVGDWESCFLDTVNLIAL